LQKLDAFLAIFFNSLSFGGHESMVEFLNKIHFFGDVTNVEILKNSYHNIKMDSNKKYESFLNVPTSKALQNIKNKISGSLESMACPNGGSFAPHNLQFLLQMISASIICAVGFSTNSETTVIGSMLISPIGGLIVDWGKGNLKFRNVAGKLIVTFLAPFIAGFVAGYTTTPEEGSKDEVAKGRGKTFFKNKSLFLGTTLVALAAGLLFAWDEGTPGIGIGIATALLPPIVATGFALGRASHTAEEKSKHVTTFTAKDAGYSFSVFLINFLTLLISTFGFKKLSDSVCGPKFQLNTSAGTQGNDAEEILNIVKGYLEKMKK